jgi:hypothetical protein
MYANRKTVHKHFALTVIAITILFLSSLHFNGDLRMHMIIVGWILTMIMGGLFALSKAI